MKRGHPCGERQTHYPTERSSHQQIHVQRPDRRPLGPSPTKRKQLISNMAPSACSTAEKVRGGSTNVGQKGRKRGAYCHQSGASAARTSAGFGGSEEGSDDEVEGDIFGRTTRRPRSKPQSSALSFGRQVLEEHVVIIGALKRFVWRH